MFWKVRKYVFLYNIMEMNLTFLTSWMAVVKVIHTCLISTKHKKKKYNTITLNSEKHLANLKYNYKQEIKQQTEK